MVSLAGLSAVGKGYQEAEKSYQTSRLLEQSAEDTLMLREGQDALGNTLKMLQQVSYPGAQAIGAPAGAPGVSAGVQAPQAPPPPSPPGMPQLRPQTPMPGQASVPMQQPGGGGPGSFQDRWRQADTGQITPEGPQEPPQVPGTPQVQLAQAQQQQPPQQGQRVAGPPGIPQPQGQMTLENAAQLIIKANPGIKPRALVGALKGAQEYLLPQAKLELAEAIAELKSRTQIDTTGMKIEGQKDVAATRQQTALIQTGARMAEGAANRGSREYIAELSARTKKEVAGLSAEARAALETQRQTGRLDIANLNASVRKEIAGMSVEARKEIAASAEAGRESRFGRGEDRRERTLQWKMDTKAQDVEQKTAALEARIRSTTDRNELAKLNAEANAFHKQMTEIMATSSLFNTMDDKQKKTQREQINSRYQSILDRIRQQQAAPAGPQAAPTGAPKGDRGTVGDTGPRVVPTISVTRPGTGGPPPADVLMQFNDALAAGKPRDALIQRLKEQGYSTEGL